MSAIAQNLSVVCERIKQDAHAAGRRVDDVMLLAVSKTFGVPDIIEAIHAGQRAFGENYLQEALDKMPLVQAQVPTIPLAWHFIGPIQSNKTRQIAGHFDWVHSVDREKIGRRLSEQRPEGLPELNICLQVNVSGEASKSGVPLEEVLPLARVLASLPRLRLRGLMAVPEPTPDRARQHAAFAALRECLALLQRDGLAVDTLSMGMSADMDVAIAEGATIVRIGSAIFGNRTYP